MNAAGSRQRSELFSSFQVIEIGILVLIDDLPGSLVEAAGQLAIDLDRFGQLVAHPECEIDGLLQRREMVAPAPAQVFVTMPGEQGGMIAIFWKSGNGEAASRRRRTAFAL